MKFADTVLVTGGAGFIGSNYLNVFVPRMPERRFVNVDSLTYAGSLKNLEVSKAANYAFEKVDIRDKKKLEKLFKKYKPSGVINFAAESHVDASIKDPALFMQTNVIGTYNLLSLAKEYGVKRFHQISTDEVYGALQKGDPAFEEDAPLRPRNPYSASKASADVLVRAYHETYGLDVVITRSGNNYGPNQDSSKVIPLFFSRLLKGKKVPLYSKGEHVREWIYVEDCAHAIHIAYEKGRSGQTYNISGGNELTNLELTKKILALTGRDDSYIERVADRPGHDFRYALKCDKLRGLGWSPKVSFDDGLRRTFEHMKQRRKA